MMRLTYSPSADALALQLATGTEIRTRELAPGVHADFDGRGRLVGVEILDASTHYDRAELEQLAAPVEYLTLAEAAKESQLSPATLKAQIHNRRLPALKRGRDWLVARHELWSYLENRAPQGRPARRRAARRTKAARATAGAA